MRAQLRRFFLAIVVLLPEFSKKPIYQYCFGYRIGRRVRIGFAYLDCSELVIDDDARISHGVFFTKCGKVQIGKHVRIGPLNLFRGGQSIQLDDYALIQRLNHFNALISFPCTNNPVSSFYLGYGSIVTNQHLVDFTDSVQIGRHTVLGGRSSSIWTHSRRIAKPVRIGNYCYLGSGVQIAPGAKLADCCIVALGAVIKHETQESHSLWTGVPAKRERALTALDYNLIFDKTRPDLPEEVYPNSSNGKSQPS